MSNNLLLKIPRETLREYYVQYVDERILSMSKLTSVITLMVIPYFIYEDLMVSNLPTGSVIFRALPLVISLISLFLLISPLKKFMKLVRGIYISYLVSLMVMMCGLLIITVKRVNYQTFIIGTIVIIFCIYAGAVYGMKTLIPVYGIPLAAVIIYFTLQRDISAAEFALLSNPFATAVVCTVLSELQNKSQFKEFTSSKLVELHHRELTTELNLARAVQNNLFPDESPDIEGVSFESVYLPMIGIGGDLYDIIEFNEPNLVGVFISDVSGHGVPAALIASMIKTLINTAGSYKREPGQLLKYINDKLIGETDNHFVTVFYGIYNSQTGSFKYARGGHNYPFLIRGEEIIELRSKGKFLALFRDIHFEEKEMKLEKGDKILFYTDGLVEAKGAGDSMFEYELVPDLLLKYRLLNNSEYVKKLFDKLIEFKQDPSFEDDVCVVGMEITGSG